MRVLLFTVLLFISITISCSTTKNSSAPSTQYVPEQGMQLILDSELPFDSNLTTSVAKVFRGNQFTGSGAFVSSNGLFLTNYSVALQYFATNSANPAFFLSDGYLAEQQQEELPIPGISLLIEVAQIDVTEEFASQISDSASNFEIGQIKQQVGQALIGEKQAEMPGHIVQINDVFSGNQQIMSIYEVVNDVRLVFAPSLPFSDANTPSGKELFDTASIATVLLRGYKSDSETGSSPYQPSQFLSFSNGTPSGTTSIALGFPDRTYRLESERAFKFYNEETNPYILNSYKAFIAKENALARQNPQYELASLLTRFNAQQQIDQYELIQNKFIEESLFQTKRDSEQDFKNWIETDTTIRGSYTQIYYYIEQAFDIANQNGAIFYSTSYVHALSRLDELAGIFKTYLEINQPNDVQNLINMQYQQLSGLNIEAELDLYKEFILLLSSVPEEQAILTIESLLEGASEDEYETAISEFLGRMRTTSFLLNPEKTENVITNHLAYDDSLFAILDESLFINDMARNNQGIYVAYLRPARQVLVNAKMDFYGKENILPDANGTLRYNYGVVDSTSADGKFLVSKNDFSGKAPGSVLLDSSGKLLGIIDNSVAENILSNYLFTEENAYVKAIRGEYILNQISAAPGSEVLLQELGLPINQ